MMFYRKSVLFALFLLFPAMAWGAADCGPEAAPSAVRELPAVRMTGPVVMVPNPLYVVQSVMEGDRIAHDFVIQNIGDATVRIEKVESG